MSVEDRLREHWTNTWVRIREHAGQITLDTQYKPTLFNTGVKILSQDQTGV